MSRIKKAVRRVWRSVTQFCVTHVRVPRLVIRKTVYAEPQQHGHPWDRTLASQPRPDPWIHALNQKVLDAKDEASFIEAKFNGLDNLDNLRDRRFGSRRP